MHVHVSVLTWLICSACCSYATERVRLQGDVLDADSGQPVACRVYLRSQDGSWHFVRSAVPRGTAIEYRKQRGESSVEIHTTISAGGFVADLAPGQYELTVERGKEYSPYRRRIQIDQRPQQITVRLKRWIDMAAHKWYSGETHVHRDLQELPQLMLAEDLNVALPLTYWVTVSDTAPGQSDRNQTSDTKSLIEVDATHVIWPLNTEYEIFRVGDQRHTLGAVFALNHKTVLQQGVPPVRPIADRVHREGGLLELDKHNWPWSMMLVPVMQVDLYELTNNHLWQTEFFFRTFGEQPAEYMNVERDERGMTERGWLEFTFQNYYALLNCGFRLRPTAGTASGVHPVPLGFGRVYVHLPGGFSYPAWIEGLGAGRSFVTTGPMLAVQLDDQSPGTTFRQNAATTFHLTGWVRSELPVQTIEIVAAGSRRRSITPTNRQIAGGAYESRIDERVSVDGSTWLAIRCFAETADGRIRFAHTAPYHVEVAGEVLRPRREEVDYLVQRVAAQIERNAGLLPDEAMQEYRDALQVYQRLRETAR